MHGRDLGPVRLKPRANVMYGVYRGVKECFKHTSLLPGQVQKYLQYIPYIICVFYTLVRAELQSPTARHIGKKKQVL